MLSAKYYCIEMIHKEYSHNAILLASDALRGCAYFDTASWRKHYSR